MSSGTVDLGPTLGGGGGGGGGGTVTSVGLVMPSIFAVAGSPVTSSGAFTVTFNTEAANTVFAGPASGGAASPTFRALVAADVPAISLTTGISGVLPVANGGTNIASYAIGDTLYASGTTTLSKLAIGTPGQFYRVDTTIPIIEDWIEPSKEIQLFEDWITTSTGDLGWSGLSTGGLATVTGAGSDVSHSGIIVLDIATGANNVAALGLSGSTSGNALCGFVLGGGQITMEWLVNVQILATTTDDYTYRVGLSRQLGTVLDGLSFTYNRSNNVNWVAETTNASTSTLTDSGVAVAAATWVKLKIVINAAASSVQFFINGTSVATNTTNINTTNLMCPKMRMLRTAGSTAGRVIYHDYFKCYQRLTTTR